MRATIPQIIPDPDSSTSILPAGPSRPISRLGRRVDAWNETVDGRGDQADDVQRAFERQLVGRGIPYATASPVRLSTTWGGAVELAVTRAVLASGVGGYLQRVGGAAQTQERRYILVRDTAKTTIAVRIAPYGNDLYLGWAIFTRPVWNAWAFAIALGVPALRHAGPIFSAAANLSEPSVFSPTGGALTLMGAVVSLALSIAMWSALLLVIGALGYGHPLALFRRPQNFFEETDAFVMARAVHKSLLRAADEVGLDAAIFRKKDAFALGSTRNLFM